MESQDQALFDKDVVDTGETVKVPPKLYKQFMQKGFEYAQSKCTHYKCSKRLSDYGKNKLCASCRQRRKMHVQNLVYNRFNGYEKRRKSK